MFMDWSWCLLIYVTSLQICSAFWSGDCVLDVNKDLPSENAPVLLRRGSYGYELANPDDVITMKTFLKGQHQSGILRIPHGDEIYATCPGYGNSLLGLKNHVKFATFKCLLPKKILRMDRHPFRSRQLKCTQPVTSIVRNSGSTCGLGNATFFDLGYSVTPETNPSSLHQWAWGLVSHLNKVKRVLHEGKSSFLRVLTSCYDPLSVHSIYSIHILQGAKIAGAETKPFQPSFNKGQALLYSPGFDIDKAYNLTNQMKALVGLLGQTRAEILLHDNQLVRALLAPQEDFLMGTWQASAFTYLNIVPQWQSINKGNWYSLEQNIRRIADKTKSTLIIATGTYGVLRLRDDRNNTKEIYLEPNHKLLPVPAMLWKLVYSPKNRSCIAFVMSNNPFSSDPSRDSPLCEDICESHGWPIDFTLPSSGIMYCCTAQSLRAAVPYVPKYPCLNVLENQIESAQFKTPTNFWNRIKCKFMQ